MVGDNLGLAVAGEDALAVAPRAADLDNVALLFSVIKQGLMDKFWIQYLIGYCFP